MNQSRASLIAAIGFLGLAAWVLFRYDRTDDSRSRGDSLRGSETDSPLHITQKANPGGRCVYTMDISFRRGGKKEEKQLFAEAFSMSEARAKFQATIDKTLRGATIEKLHVERSVC